MVSDIIFVLIILFWVTLAGFFAGSETGIYQLSRLRLRIGIEKGHFSYVILGRLMDDSSRLLISMLIGTNLAYYAVTTFVTYLLLDRFIGKYTVEIFATLLTVPVLFVFSELIPKSLFYHRADFLMPVSAPILLVFHKIFKYSGAVAFLRYVSGVFFRLSRADRSTGGIGNAVGSPYIKAILQETQEEGYLSSVQADILRRVVDIPRIRVGAVMTPIERVAMVDVNCGKTALFKALTENTFTRLPVYRDRTENIIGFIDIYEALCSKDDFSSLDKFVKPIQQIAAATPVTKATNIMQSGGQKIVLVTMRLRGAVPAAVGIVTMKDLVEELLGELSEW
jgi:CBS domain containing-hemolysin-like protein